MKGKAIFGAFGLVLSVIFAPGTASAVEGDIHIEGTIVDGSGQPKGNVSVQVFFYADDTDARVVNGKLVGSAETSSTGAFVIDAPSTPEIDAAAAGNDGVANFDLMAQSGRMFLVRGVTDEVESDAVAALSQRRKVTNKPLRIKMAYGAPGVAPKSSKVPRDTEVAPCCCPPEELVAQNDKYTVVGEMHITGDATGNFKYGQTADSDVSVGINFAGSSSWSLSGTVHVGNSRSGAVTFSKAAHNQYRVTTQMHYKKYFINVCAPGTDYYKVKASAWNAGSGNENDVSSRDGHCDDTYLEHAVHFLHGDQYDTGTQNSANYSGAVEVFGASLKAQSGFSTYVNHHWQFGNNVTYYYLCGINAKPGSATQIFMGPNVNYIYA